ncbi:Phosphoglucomutase-2 [Boothiomyces sp. JEL0866]|nr:Phosphoglucomutase-2 [Boothiomyces sp. JEL0866]
MSDLSSLVQEYLSLDQNPITNQDIKLMYENKDFETLTKLLTSRLEFGTAGLRAEMGSGYSRMNELTVIQATQGLYSHLHSTVPNLESKGVVVGHDHRFNSDSFAKLTAAVFLSKGVKVYYLKGLVHTPLVPFTVTNTGAACGIMITASHNPKQDNGYKVYAANGCQIIAPTDKHVAQKILENLQPWTWDYELVDNSPLVVEKTQEFKEKYFARLSEISHFQGKTKNVKFLYTAMHGVGLEFAKKSFKAFNLAEFEMCQEQVLPDPEFPTVKFPNPEEKGALDLAIKSADRVDAKIILANDPDADRLAIAEKVGDSWHVYTGNQIGIILASFILQSFKEKGQTSNLGVLTTTVSSHMLEELAKSNGMRFEETLTGFKWLGNKAIDMEREGTKAIFAYEEAIGFMCYDIVKDKDGVSALGVFAEWANHLYGKGQTVYEHLQNLYKLYGFWVSQNSYFICHDKPTIAKIFDKIRYAPSTLNLEYPKEIGGFKVVYVRDLTIGYDSLAPENKPTLPVSSSSQMITFKLENDCLITLRTSGTEPKIKYYTEYKGRDAESAKNELAVIVQSMIDNLLEPRLNNLQ